MSYDAIEAFLRLEFELLQYLAFFGLFLTFAVLENLVPRDRAAQERLRRWPVNGALTALNIIVLGAVPVGAIAAADWAQANEIGVLNIAGLSAPVVFILGFLARGFFSWGTHFLNHKVPFLWAIHRVHHVDTRLDVSTTVRFHPLEFVVTTPLVLAGIVLCGIPPLALLIYELMDAGVTVFSHSNVRLPRWLDRFLRLFIVTPDVHRVHHSSYRPETDSNYGAVLTIWDRLLGTWRTKSPEALAAQQNGLAECQDGRSHSLWWLLFLPFMRLRSRDTSTGQAELV